MISIAPGFSLPADAITQTYAFLGRRGGGKTYGASVLAEGMLDAGAQVIALDPVGVWYGLRIASDGKGAGYDLPILGGLHGDIPLEPMAGALIADLLVERHLSAVVDVSQMRKHDRRVFATYFAEQLFHRQKVQRTPVHLFIEEAQAFVPQQIGKGGQGFERGPDGKPVSDARMLGAFEDLVKLGRNFGIGVTLISQRPQAVNKDALNQTEALFAMQTNGAQERAALEKWIIEQGIASKNIVDELPGLPIGTAYVWSPSWLHRLEKVQIKQRKTYNASATPTAGTARIEPRPLSKDELTQVQAAMSATIERAKADDPKELRRRIAELERQLKTAPTQKAEPVTVEVPVIPQSVWELGRAFEAIEMNMQRIRAAFDKIKTDGHAIKRPMPPKVRIGDDTHRQPPPVKTFIEKWKNNGSAPPSDGAQKLSKAQRSILTVLAQYGEPMSLKRVAILAGYTLGAGALNNALGSLRSLGYILRGDPARITDAGAAALGEIEPLPQGAELREYWLRRLTKAERAILTVLLEIHPHAIAPDDLALRAGYTPKTGGFNNAIGRLRTIQLAEGYGEIKAADAFFEEVTQ